MSSANSQPLEVEDVLSMSRVSHKYTEILPFYVDKFDAKDPEDVIAGSRHPREPAERQTALEDQRSCEQTAYIT